MGDVTVWGIHAGKYADGDPQFKKEQVVGIGWAEVGDLSRYPADREAYKKAILDAYPTVKAGAVPVYAGVLYRFVHEVKEGDLFIYPSKVDREVHIGRVTGSYEFRPEMAKKYPNTAADPYASVRPVKWLKSFPRTYFSQGALYEIGSAVTLFQVKNYADEFISALQGAGPVVPPDEDPTVALVADEIEQTTRDFILKTLATEFKGHPFAGFVSHLLRTMGYRTRVAPPGPDGGVDIRASRDPLGFEPPILKVQVKSGEGKVGLPEVSALYGNVENSEFGLLVSLGEYTKQARDFAHNRSNLRLVDGSELVDLVLEHYESFDAKYKGALPLRSVYVPSPKADED
ncbi:MAG: restriction endonuclease [Actinobacteria bacterium]|nr:restriction endonuclease [Actinomycetota bacterium]